jgi:hypothetical protein
MQSAAGFLLCSRTMRLWAGRRTRWLTDCKGGHIHWCCSDSFLHGLWQGSCPSSTLLHKKQQHLSFRPCTHHPWGFPGKEKLCIMDLMAGSVVTELLCLLNTGLHTIVNLSIYPLFLISPWDWSLTCTHLFACKSFRVQVDVIWRLVTKCTPETWVGMGLSSGLSSMNVLHSCSGVYF